MNRSADSFWTQNLARRSWACLLPFAACLLVIPYELFPLWFPFCDGTPPSCRQHLPALLEYLGSLQQQGIPNSLTPDDLLAISSYPLHQRWSSANGLYLVLCLAAILGSGYVIWKMLELDERDGAKRIGAVALLLIASFGIAFLFNVGSARKVSLWSGFVASTYTQRFNLVGIKEVEDLFEWISLGSAICLAVASALTLLLPPAPPGRGKKKGSAGEAHYLAMQMRCLRYLLYGAAVLLIVSQFRIEALFRRALAPLHPLSLANSAGAESAAMFIFKNLEAAFMNMVARLGVLNTLLLAAVYVPAAAILQNRATQLAGAALATTEEDSGLPQDGKTRTGVTREAWMREHGLAVSFKEMLPRLAAVLAPLFSGPLGELISRLSS